MFHATPDAKEIAKVQDFIIAERHKCLSDREWSFRLRGYGYDVRREGDGHVVSEMFGAGDMFTIGDASLKRGVEAGDQV